MVTGTRKIISKEIQQNADVYVGRVGELWFQEGTQTLRFGDNETPGGQGASAGVVDRLTDNANNQLIFTNGGLTWPDSSVQTTGFTLARTTFGTNAVADTFGVAIGASAQGDTYGVTVGAFAGTKHVTNNTSYTVALGAFAQQNANPGDATGVGAVAVGVLAGDSNQGQNAVALGRYAGRNNQAAGSIVINATGGDLENTTANSLVVKPIRNVQGSTVLQYNSTTGEITYNENVTVAGVLKIDDGVHEKFQPLQDATGVVTHDCSLGHIFFHTSPDANWTANFTNLNLTTTYATSLTLVIAQGATGYYPNAMQIGGAAQTINWLGNTLPTPSTNRTDVVTFSILNSAGTYTVLGQLTGF
jgi:hypothetical protein